MALPENTPEFEKYLEALQSKQHPTGYFFCTNEVIHPVYFDECLQPDMTIEEAWKFFCETWLNSVYDANLIGLLPFLIRGKVTNGQVVTWGHNVDFYKQQIADIFKLTDPQFQVEPIFQLETKIPDKYFILLRNVYKYVKYINHLPWQVQFSLKQQTEPKESSAIWSNMCKQSLTITKAKRRLGAMPSLSKL